MASPPFIIDTTGPSDGGFLSQHAPDERGFRDIVESWLLFEHGTSGHHRFTVGNTTTRNGLINWETGSLFWNTDHNAPQVFESGLGWFNPGINTGRTMMFQQDNAPTGWTARSGTFFQDAIMRGRNTASNSFGGTHGFTTVFVNNRTVSGTVAAHAITESELPSHRHTFDYLVNNMEIGNDFPNCLLAANFATGASGARQTDLVGSGNTHTHGWSGTLDISLKFYDVILAERNTA